MRSGERPAGVERSRQRAPRAAPSATAVGGGAGAPAGAADPSLGPFSVGPGYSPWKDPTVVVLLVISLAALLLFVGGATFGPALSDDDGDGVFPVIDILTGDDGGDDPALSLAANRTELTIGERVAFSVTDEDGEPVRDATVAVGGATHEVDAEGRVVVRIDRSGAVTASASAPGTNETVRESEVFDLRVAPRQVDLAVRANRSTATAGEPIALTLARADTGTHLRGSIAATVVPEGRSPGSPSVLRSVERTDGSQLVVVPERSGQLFVRGTRAEQGGETFRSYTDLLEIERRPVALELAVEPNATTAGESVDATVRRSDTSEAIAATLSIEGPEGIRTVETDPDGTAELTFETAGARTIEASAEPTPSIRFVPDAAAVEVERREVALEASVDRPAITDGGHVTVTVTRADTGEPVDATVEIAGEPYDTDLDGTVGTSVDVVGEHAIVVTAPDTPAETFTPVEHTLTVVGATVELGNLSAPASAAPGETVTVEATAANRGPEDAADTFELVVDGEVVDRAVVDVAADEEATVGLRGAVPEEPGSYEVAIRGSDDAVSGTIEVES